jgi:3-oxoacyl-[acyl-carrier protein] reductase
VTSKPVALVTGASRGIGRGIALELASDHLVVGTFRGRKDAADSLAAECGADMVQSDISSAADRKALVDGVVAKYGRLDLLVNNAGIAPRERKDILEASEEIFDEVLDTNLKGPYFLTQAAAQAMVRQGSGRIVFVTSISAYTASVMRGEYCISKAGLAMAVQLWAQRLAAHNVGVF